MKKVFFPFLLMITVIGFSNPYLKKFDTYKQASYYKNQVYKEHTFQTFYLLEDIKKTVLTDSFDVHLFNACLFFATNKLRAIKKKPLFIFDKKLKEAAAIHSYQMATNHFFAHENNYESKIKTPKSRLSYVDIKSIIVAENCSKEYVEEDDDITYIELAQQIIEGLYNSPPHKSNLMHTGLRYCALAAAIEKVKNNVYILVTQDFYK
jgi:uncharacterized protein YkwD